MVVEVDLGNLVMREEDVKEPFSDSGTQGQAVTSEGFAHAESTTPEVDPTIDLHLPYFVSGCVLNGGQAVRELPCALSIAMGRNHHAQGLVRPLEVVYISPAIEVLLAMPEVVEDPLSDGFRLQGAMKPLALAQSLRMVRAGVRHIDAEMHQPDG
jgi:hypothetical protein